MAVAMDMDDDLFFADISRQISLIINDDADEGPPISLHHQSVAFQAFSTMVQQSNGQPRFPCEHTAWKTSESRGTGVFIPKSSNWRKRNRQRRSIRTYNTIEAYKQLPDTPSPHPQPVVAQLHNSSKC